MGRQERGAGSQIKPVAETAQEESIERRETGEGHGPQEHCHLSARSEIENRKQRAVEIKGDTGDSKGGEERVSNSSKRGREITDQS